MKTLVYTTCDFSAHSYKCTELLYRTLLVNNENFDFYIISNKTHSQSDFPIIIEDDPKRNLCQWKYTKNIPGCYDQYFYLDSDILCFEKLENMCDENDLSFCSENHKMSDNEYFCYKDATPEEKIEMTKFKGFNAGGFGFKTMNFITELRSIMDPKISNVIIPDNISRHEMFELILPDGQLDQTLVNYWIFKHAPDLKYYDFGNQTVIRPDDTRITEGKTIYHFCGFQMEMSSKYQRMLHFCHNNNIII